MISVLIGESRCVVLSQREHRTCEYLVRFSVLFGSLSTCLALYLHLLASVTDKHAPFRTKRAKNKRSPWITNELLREIRKRNFLKKKAASTNDPSIWKQFKDARNKANNSVKKAKRKYFSENLDANKSDPRKTWRLINELQSR